MLKGSERAIKALRARRAAWEKAAAGAVRETAEAACAAAAELVPVRTGRLKRSLRVIQEDSLRAQVTADCPYAVFVELGSGVSGPQPFMSPAAHRQRRAFPERIRRRLK